MLFEEMVSAGVRAIVAGVAAEGLGPEWLGRPLDGSALAELKGLRDRYGISVMGEGGEYESMTLDSPMHLKRIEAESSERRLERGSGTLEVTGIRLSEKDH